MMVNMSTKLAMVKPGGSFKYYFVNCAILLTITLLFFCDFFLLDFFPSFFVLVFGNLHVPLELVRLPNYFLFIHQQSV